MKMFLPFIRSFVFTTVLVFAFASFASAQSGRVQATPTPTHRDDEMLRVVTEEIKLNVLAFDENGNFFRDVKERDLVITENNVLHQPASVRRLPANVLIVMDTGGEMRVEGLRRLTTVDLAVRGKRGERFGLTPKAAN